MKIYLYYLLLFVGYSSFLLKAEPRKIAIAKDMVIILSAQDGNPMNMFDGDTSTDWFPGWNRLSYPATLLIELKNTVHLTAIRIYDGLGTQQIKISAGMNPFNTQDLVNINQDQYNQWRQFNISIQAQYLLISLPQPKIVSSSEIEFYTDSPLVTIPNPTPIYTVQPTVNGALGVNSFHWIPQDLLSPFKYVREYQYWQWMEASPGKTTFEPTRSGAGNFDTHYQSMKNAGFVVVPCINQSPDWLNTAHDTAFNHDWKPVAAGSNPENPASYIHFAKFLFQLSARYGKQNISDQLLTIDEIPFWSSSQPNVKRSGLNLLEYIEVWNEPDKTWKGPQAYFSPYQFAAMMSAAYDGHCHTLGPDAGIKTANPDMKVVMGGLARLSTDYIKAMDLWFKHYRKDGQFASDVMNFHHYANAINRNTNSSPIGISPEEDQLDVQLKAIKQYVNTYFPRKEIWLSEYGYDTNNSTQRASVTSTLTTQQDAQASWITRSMLMIMSSNIDKSFLYNIDDTGTSMDGLYSQSGTVGHATTNYKKKLSWYCLQQLRETMLDCKYNTLTKNGGIMKYTFTKGGKLKIIVVYTLSGKATFTIDFPGTEISYYKRSEVPVIVNPINVLTPYTIDEAPLFFTIIK